MTTAVILIVAIIAVVAIAAIKAGPGTSSTRSAPEIQKDLDVKEIERKMAEERAKRG